MAKRTAVIDIGSNSISFVVYEKSSRYAFHLIEKLRSKVRIGEGAYEKEGLLNHEAMQRAHDTLEDYLFVARSLGCQKVFAVATSALRDAPNKKVFTSMVKESLGLDIKIINGKDEAYMGAIAATNLLPKISEATTIDIGGGSTELARIVDGKIVDTISLNLGTVRLKELFFDKKKKFSEVSAYINSALEALGDHYQTETVIGIGGTIRALSLAILKETQYPLDSLHAFNFTYKKHRNFIEEVAKCEVMQLKKTTISKSRYDTVREGSAIFFMLCDRLGAKEVITSKAGVREGVYLKDILRSSHDRFPHNFNVSIKSLIDRFAIYHKNIPHVQKCAVDIYDAMKHFFDPEGRYRHELQMASKLLLIAARLNIYSNSYMGFGFLIENLNFALSHEEKILIALILKYAYKNEIDEKEVREFKRILPSTEVVVWLSFILSLSICIHKNKQIKPLHVQYQNNSLRLISSQKMFLCKECIKKLKKPASFAIILESSS